jgi:signal transduction histidine kinase
VLREATATLRQGVRDLRTLLLEIHPPNLQAAGLSVALSDLLSPLHADGIKTALTMNDWHQQQASVRGDTGSGEGFDSDPHDALIYRVAREAVRNAQMHSAPTAVSVSLVRDHDRTRLTVTDDGCGFVAAERQRRSSQGHVGLSLLEEIVAQVDGKLQVRSLPGAGTTVSLELPAR